MTPETALKSITWALTILEASSLSPKTIHILPGLYSTSATGEEFPLIASGWVDLEGAGADDCVVDAERQGTVLYCLPDGVIIDSLTITEGYGDYGGGIHYAYHSQSNPVCSLMHCTFTDNMSGGGECAVFWDYWLPKLNASATAEDGSGTAKLSEKGGNPVVLNCIFWDDWPHEIFSKEYSSITYCDVTGGYPGEGNIDCDPVFSDLEAGNYYVIDTSCCVGAGYGGPTIGAFGIGCYAVDCGDVDGSLSVNILDVGLIVNYLYRQGAPPLQPTAADIDASGTVDLIDATHLIKYLYKNGSEPDCRKQLTK